MHINDLCDELLSHIFWALPLSTRPDLLNLILTCKRCRRILWSKEFLERISSFKYQSRFLIYHCLSNKTAEQSPFYQYIHYDENSPTPTLTLNGDLSAFREDIRNCPLRVLFYFSGIIILDTSDSPASGNVLIKCTYNQQHALTTKFHMKVNQWYHIAIVIHEKNDLKLYIDGVQVGNWSLEEKINRQNISVAPFSTISLASHCGVYQWHGSLFEFCLWNRCLEAYEIREMAQTRTNIEAINFLPTLA